MTAANPVAIAPEALRPRVEGDFANDRVKQSIMSRLFGEPLAPAKIGRFTVIRELGRGATGVVYAAYDEQLERKVAVKLLHADGAEAEARARILREAQAMARLSHPNIVSVHEVGTHHQQVYIAMEFVHGMTLGTWLKHQPRSWREVVEVFRQAGSGLAAAHEAGLVHRDFKPQNAMVGDDGRVRVLDFGLARADADPEVFADLERTRDSQARLTALDASLTVTGSLVGTPAYMAPEQFRGEKADPRSDQFALCVALYEALFHERPFRGETLGELMREVQAGKVREPAQSGKVPRALRAAVLRGLAARPEQRHPSIDALMAAIDRVVEPRRGAWLAAAGLAAALAGGAGLAYHSSPQGQVCEDSSQAVAAVWSPARADAIGAALRGVDPQADEAWSIARERFDRYAADWTAAAADACEDHQVRREQSLALYELRRACLGDRLRAFGSALELFGRPEPTLAIRANDIAAGLEPVADCSDPEVLQRLPRPPDDPALAEQVAALRAELARADAYRRASKLDEALRGLDALAPGLPPAYPPLRAELGLVRGQLLATVGRHKDALLSLQTAYFTALSASYDRLAIAAATELVELTGVHLADFDAAGRWVRHARALLARGGAPAQQAALADIQGRVALATGRYAEARDHFQRALDLYQKTAVHELPEVAVLRRILADVAVATGDLDTAQKHLDTALASLERQYCDRHPDIAYALGSVGKLAQRRGDLDTALATFLRARDNLAGVVAEDSHVYTQLTASAVDVLLQRRDWDHADDLVRRALAPTDAGALPTDARPLHPDRFRLRAAEVQLLVHRREFVAAEREARSLLADAERAWGPDEPYVALALVALADALAAAGRPADAVPLAERAVTVAASRGERVHPSVRYDSAFALARVLALAGQQTRAEALAREAQSLAETTGDARFAAAIATWLGEHETG